ncbi:MAG TPA: low molecular weight protein-tyrosine-phosphatase [Saprospiraceae bacterium]|jgi:protein-tyrosine phosphatase|nr:MAG: protein tyrosine phosphatase [Candidatus Parvibacillus calidus]MBX2937528.1 low molecular weight phosphotyrosine protein phosphatase [Saprospiraceae bacterium]MBX7177981.1 low molecular weight phosphotyrosine protein phosphatase [Saprospiraceae bacterium]MCB0592361.1 low molecular weight phosphotyrosine protein phosphatase [Saprospiraceae bacterium]MCC7149527.1 low molecular weight phosphotyrosine protein phosphatase [Saprospiraceae bacterium]
MKILMVCLGNICRSPLAEGIMRAKAESAGLKIKVDSAGTSDYHIGEAPHRNSVRIASEHNIDITGLKARQFTKADLETFDLIYVMDESNYKNVIQLATNKEQREKVLYLLNEVNPGSNASVPDPWYGGYDGYRQVFDLLEEACSIIARKIMAGELSSGVFA